MKRLQGSEGLRVPKGGPKLERDRAPEWPQQAFISALNQDSGLQMS